MTAISGLRGTGNWGTDERPKNFRENILFYNPNGSAPIFAMTGRAKKKTVNDPEFSWWAEPNGIVRLQVSGSHASGDTTITIDSADPTVSDFSVVWGSALNLKPGDLLLVEKATDTVAYNHEMILVTQVVSSTQIIVSRGASGTTAGTIADDSYLLLVGSAYAEGTAAPLSVSRNPLKLSNYTQIFKDTYELTGTADKTHARTGSAWSNDKKRKMYDHSRAIEFAMMFGNKYETTGSNGKPLRYMGGLRSQIPASNTHIFSSAVTLNGLMDELEPCWDVTIPEGSTQRVAFTGNKGVIELAKLAAGAADLNFQGHATYYGLEFQKYVTPFGELLVKAHPLMTSHGQLKQSMFILDFAAIKYVCLNGRDTKTNDDVQNKDEDLRRGYVQTECSMMLELAGRTCGFIGNISAT